MTLNSRSYLFIALGCGLVMTPPIGLRAQGATPPAQQAQPAAGQNQAQGQGQPQEPDPLKRERSDKEKFAAQKAVRQ